MPEPIQLTSVSDLNLKDFKDLEKGTLKNGSIKLGKSTYSVKFIDGKVSVSRNFHFFNLFRPNKQNELRDAFNAQMYNNSKNEALYTNTFKALEKNFKGNGLESMVLFGMEELTDSNKQGLEALEQFTRVKASSKVKEPLMGNEVLGLEKLNNQQPVNPNLANPVKLTNFEKLIGIAGLHKNDMKSDIISTLDSLSDSALLDYRLKEIQDSDVDKTLKKDWLLFLKKNANRVNIFRKLKQAINDSKNPQKKDLVGWAAMMRKHGIDKALDAFLQKNMKGDLQVTSHMVAAFKLFLDNFDISDFRTFSQLKSSLRFGAALDENQVEIFMDCLFNAVQREVMKLGLEFCRDKNIPVLFQWTDSDGKTVSSKELKNQLWSPDYVKDKRPKFSPILHTVMRHALRMQKAPGNKLKLVQVNGAAPV